MVDFYTFKLMETGMNTLQRSRQNLQHHPNCVSTLPNVKTAHFENTVANRFRSAFVHPQLAVTQPVPSHICQILTTR